MGGNNVGKTAVVEALALVFGRERVTTQISDWDFFGGLPRPDSRFTIVCTVTDFDTNNPYDHPNWFAGESSAHPTWWHEDDGTLTFETDCPGDASLAAQVALCGRYDEEDCEFETKRYFYHGAGDPFTDTCDVVPFRRLEELGVFVIPGNRQWERLMSFGSSSFLKALRQSDAIPGGEIERLKTELRNSKSGIENANDFRAILASAEAELRSFLMLKSDSTLAYRTTSLDTFGVLQNLLPHVKDAQGNLLPLSKQGAGMVSLQSFLVVLAIAQKRKKGGKNFILVAEEPELHLHPSLHKRLSNRIRAVSSQSLITTHSPLIAATYKPTESILMRNNEGSLTAERLRNEPVKDIRSNAIRKLYLQKRELFYEAILGAAVIIPEGECDYEWLRLLQKIVESSDDPSSSLLPLSIVPTQDSAVVDTYSEVVRFRNNVLPFVDGDLQGEEYLNRFCSMVPRPEDIVQLGEGAGIEYLAAWVLEPSLSNPGSVLNGLLPTSGKRNLKELQRTLVIEQNKKDRELRENLVAEALEYPLCVGRAAEFFTDISAILMQSNTKNAGWKHLNSQTGVRIHVASHIRKV
jgi:putative ATP-dependent endonuclease of OLD family